MSERRITHYIGDACPGGHGDGSVSFGPTPPLHTPPISERDERIAEAERRIYVLDGANTALATDLMEARERIADMEMRAGKSTLALAQADERIARYRAVLEGVGCQRPREGGDECGGACAVCALLAETEG